MVEPSAQHLRFPFWPWPPGDPGPEIWEIIQELDAERRLQVARVLIETEIAVSEARVAGLKQLGEVMTSR
jgi:hypothetical protein